MIFPRVILIGGEAEHGKTSLAKAYKEILTSQGNTVCLINFADYLKFMCNKYLAVDMNIPEVENFEGAKTDFWRDLYQKEGTDFIRSRDQDFHSKIVATFINIYRDRFNYFILSDWRFKSEFYLLDRLFGALNLKIVRLNHKSKLTKAQWEHPSERDLDDFKFMFTFESETGKINEVAKSSLPIILDWFEERRKIFSDGDKELPPGGIV